MIGYSSHQDPRLSPPEVPEPDLCDWGDYENVNAGMMFCTKKLTNVEVNDCKRLCCRHYAD